ncbi:calcium-binding protein, partial [Asticcacaulis sp. AC402]|uniref:calcium-binding protein n=1 Tax=Asticcacaulis sp. AC402 TaxID=1282361 RepID=UPI00190FA8DE
GSASDNRLTGNAGNNHLTGLGGNDIIFGAALAPYPAATLNETGLPQQDTIATAINLAPSAFGLNSDANIANSTTVPHTTVTGTGDGFYDMYSFVVDAAGVVGTFDIDASVNLDSFLELFDADGTRLAFDDDSLITNGGGGSGFDTDSFLTHTFATAGTYFIRVGKFDTDVGSSALDVAQGYTLQVSLAGNALPPAGFDTADGADTIDGGTGNDTLMGGAGNDYVTGDNDTVTGEDGADLL